MNNKFNCECGSVCTIREKARHFKSRKHLDFTNNIEKPIEDNNIQVDNDNMNLTINDPFLEEFTNDNLINETISNTESFNNQKYEEDNIKEEHDNLKLEEKQIKLLKQKKSKHYVKNLLKMKMKKMIYFQMNQPKY
jgi:hypothetical protein